jgi:signal transduction histidine kinase
VKLHPRALASAVQLRRRTLRLHLALLYAGFVFACGAAVLAIPVFTIKTALPTGASAAVIAQQDADARTQIIRAAVVLVALVVVSAGVGWLISGRLVRPLRTITATAREISASNLSRRLSLGSGDEFAELGQTLDSLFARLQASFESQRHFVANASHELRTPIAAQRTLLQVALADPDASAGSLRSACETALTLGEQQESLIGSLLALASSERGVTQWQPFDLASIAAAALADRDRQQQAERLGLRIDSALAAAPATGDASLTASLVANLIDNALEHNVPGGGIEVITAAGPDGAALLSVSNSGPVIAPDDVSRLFLPFQQAGAERTGRAAGHGLGLAIVDAIATGHGADIAARALATGGLEVRVTWPPVRAAATAAAAA